MSVWHFGSSETSAQEVQLEQEIAIRKQLSKAGWDTVLLSCTL